MCVCNCTCACVCSSCSSSRCRRLGCRRHHWEVYRRFFRVRWRRKSHIVFVYAQVDLYHVIFCIPHGGCTVICAWQLANLIQPALGCRCRCTCSWLVPGCAPSCWCRCTCSWLMSGCALSYVGAQKWRKYTHTGYGGLACRFMHTYCLVSVFSAILCTTILFCTHQEWQWRRGCFWTVTWPASFLKGSLWSVRGLTV